MKSNTELVFIQKFNLTHSIQNVSVFLILLPKKQQTMVSKGVRIL